MTLVVITDAKALVMVIVKAGVNKVVIAVVGTLAMALALVSVQNKRMHNV